MQYGESQVHRNSRGRQPHASWFGNRSTPTASSRAFNPAGAPSATPRERRHGGETAWPRPGALRPPPRGAQSAGHRVGRSGWYPDGSAPDRLARERHSESARPRPSETPLSCPYDPTGNSKARAVSGPYSMSGVNAREAPLFSRHHGFVQVGRGTRPRGKSPRQGETSPAPLGLGYRSHCTGSWSPTACGEA